MKGGKFARRTITGPILMLVDIPAQFRATDYRRARGFPCYQRPTVNDKPTVSIKFSFSLSLSSIERESIIAAAAFAFHRTQSVKRLLSDFETRQKKKSEEKTNFTSET